MKKVGILVLFVLAACGAIAQESETRPLTSFRGIRVGEAIDVYLKKGDKESAKVEVDGVNLSDVMTEVNGSYLRIHMRSGNYQGKRKVVIYLTYVSLEKISASSASSVFSEGTLKASTLDIAAASAANVELQIEANDVTVDVASAGDITLEGKAKNLSVEASSAGSVDAYNLECEKAEARVSSAGSAKINVTKSLDAQASSGGSIRYRGNPSSTNTDSSSGGSVKKSS
jgi:hypothetical protein